MMLKRYGIIVENSNEINIWLSASVLNGSIANVGVVSSMVHVEEELPESVLWELYG